MSQLPIYIISLKRTPERKLSIQRQLDSLKLNYQFVEAIDKYDLYSEQNRTNIARQLDINKSDMESIYRTCKDVGAVSCILSHLKAHSIMIKRNVQEACVLEDDGLILPTFPVILAACQKMPGDMLMLSSQSSIIAYIARSFLKKDIKILGFLISVYKLIRYKKYWPQLNPYTLRCAAQCVVKYLFIIYLRRIKAKLSKTQYQEEQTRNVTTFAVEVGALPTQDRMLWHKITPRHYMANPLIGAIEGEEGPIPISITSCMAYVLTRSAAIKWKQAAIDLSRRVGRMPGYPISGYASKNLEMDHMPRYLYCKGDINLYVLVSPCIRAAPKYMTHSARASRNGGSALAVMLSHS